MNLLNKRTTRAHDARDYKRKPAKGQLIVKLEEHINKTHLIIEFDGYIIPVDGKKVTLLLYCREYNAELVKDIDMKDLANKLYEELQKEVRFDLSLRLAAAFDCSLSCVFPPYNYPKNEKDANTKAIIVFPRIEKKKSVLKMNIDSFKDFLLKHEKRYTTKSLTFAPTKLEYFLSQIPEGQRNTIAFPGDADGILMDKDYNIIAILEYKSDTYGKKINEESRTKYKDDTTRFNVLDDFCKLLKVPLVIIFWSDTHTKTKITIRNATNCKEVSLILEENNYDDLSVSVSNVILDLKQFEDRLI